MVILSEHLSEEQLRSKLKEASQVVEVGAVYTHYRNPQNGYRVVGLSIIEATQEAGVLYQKEFGSEGMKSITWVRPVTSWLEKVNVQNQLIPRFQKMKSS